MNPRYTYRSFHKVRRAREATALDERYLEHKTKRTPLIPQVETTLAEKLRVTRSLKSRQLAGLSRRSSARQDKSVANCSFFIRYLLSRYISEKYCESVPFLKGIFRDNMPLSVACFQDKWKKITVSKFIQ